MATANKTSNDFKNVGKIPSDILLKAAEYTSYDSPNPLLHAVNVTRKNGHLNIAFTDGIWGNKFYETAVDSSEPDISVNIPAEAIKSIYTEETIYFSVKTHGQNVVLVIFFANDNEPIVVETEAIPGDFPDIFAAMPPHRKSREGMGPIPEEYWDDVRTATKIPFEAFNPPFPRRALKGISETTRVDNSNRPVWFTSVCGTWSFDRLLLPPMMQALLNSL